MQILPVYSPLIFGTPVQLYDLSRQEILTRDGFGSSRKRFKGLLPQIQVLCFTQAKATKQENENSLIKYSNDPPVQQGKQWVIQLDQQCLLFNPWGETYDGSCAECSKTRHGLF